MERFVKNIKTSQNYLGTSRDTEPDDNRIMRHGLFHALDNALKP